MFRIIKNMIFVLIILDFVIFKSLLSFFFIIIFFNTYIWKTKFKNELLGKEPIDLHEIPPEGPHLNDNQPHFMGTKKINITHSNVEIVAKPAKVEPCTLVTGLL